MLMTDVMTARTTEVGPLVVGHGDNTTQTLGRWIAVEGNVKISCDPMFSVGDHLEIRIRQTFFGLEVQARLLRKSNLGRSLWIRKALIATLQHRRRLHLPRARHRHLKNDAVVANDDEVVKKDVVDDDEEEVHRPVPPAAVTVVVVRPTRMKVAFEPKRKRKKPWILLKTLKERNWPR